MPVLDRVDRLSVPNVHKETRIADIDEEMIRFSRRNQRRMKVEDWTKD